MSTTFGIKVPSLYDAGEEEIEVAFRGNNTGIYWINELAHLLSDDTKVIPLDNTAQGIYTIGDIKEEIKLQEKLKKK